jgi:hypothetical protein
METEIQEFIENCVLPGSDTDFVTIEEVYGSLPATRNVLRSDIGDITHAIRTSPAWSKLGARYEANWRAPRIAALAVSCMCCMSDRVYINDVFLGVESNIQRIITNGCASDE